MSRMDLNEEELRRHEVLSRIERKELTLREAAGVLRVSYTSRALQVSEHERDRAERKAEIEAEARHTAERERDEAARQRDEANQRIRELQARLRLSGESG